MTITTEKNGKTTTLALTGRLDTSTAPQLEEELKKALNDIDTLIFDFVNLDYISSAGLRVLLSAQKTMSQCGKMEIKNVSDTIREVFDITGFSDIISLE